MNPVLFEACKGNEHEGALPDAVRFPESATGVFDSEIDRLHHRVLSKSAALVVPFVLAS